MKYAKSTGGGGGGCVCVGVCGLERRIYYGLDNASLLNNGYL